MDILVFGCKKMIKFKSSKIVEYDLDYILNKINLNYNQFIELCILFGCDYLKPLLRDKPDIIYNKYKNADNILDLFENNNSNIINQYIDDFNITKRIFIDSYNKEKIPYIKTEIKEINIDDLYAFINNHCNYFSNTNIKYQISHINYLIKNNKFTNITIY